MEPARSKVQCVAYGCTNTIKSDVHLFLFPKDPEYRRRWATAIRREDWAPTGSSRLCSDHFAKDAYKVPPGLGRRPLLHATAVPTAFLHYPAHLQPPVKATRRPPADRSLVPVPKRRRPEHASASADQSPSTSNAESSQQLSVSPSNNSATHSTKAKLGRPKQASAVRVRNLLQRNDSLRRRNSRLMKKTRIQAQLLRTLESEHQLATTKLSVINGALDELLDNEANNRGKTRGVVYSDKLKAFAFTLHYYSPRAYRYLRTVFTLPHPKTIRKWLSAVDVQPGFLTDTLDSITHKHPDGSFSLVLDSMAIRKRRVVDKASNTILGLVDYGQGFRPAGADERQATEALVFLLVSLVSRERYPVAFFFVDKVSADIQARLVTDLLKLTAERNIRVLNITCDGAQANLSTLMRLGAIIPDSPHFKHPVADYQVCTTLDPVHMVKLCRNAFGTLRRFVSSSGVVDYKYVEDLVTTQQEIGLRLGTKISKAHIEWHKMKMKVRLAAQLLSTSVADALDYLRQSDDRFAQAGPTIEFIRTIDTLFDLLNSHSPFGRKWKSPLRRPGARCGDIDLAETEMQRCLSYLDSLRLLDGTPVKDCSRKTFLLGFQMAARNIITVTRGIFDSQPEMSYILAVKFSQDPLELLFSKIRARGGHNNNPDVVQFRCALRSLLVKQDITPSSNANCLEVAPSGAAVVLRPRKVYPQESNDDTHLVSQDGAVTEMQLLPQAVGDVCEYIAGYIIKTMRLQCHVCIDALVTSSSCQDQPEQSLLSQKDRGGLIWPSLLLKSICLVTEAVCRRTIRELGLTRRCPQICLIRTLMSVLSSQTHHAYRCEAHATDTIREIARRYILLRLHHESKQDQSTSDRSRLTRLVIFSHQ